MNLQIGVMYIIISNHIRGLSLSVFGSLQPFVWATLSNKNPLEFSLNDEIIIGCIFITIMGMTLLKNVIEHYYFQ